MPSNDVDGKPVLILSHKEAERVWFIMSHVMLNDEETKVLDKVKVFLREAAMAPFSTELPRPSGAEPPRGVM